MLTSLPVAPESKDFALSSKTALRVDETALGVDGENLPSAHSLKFSTNNRTAEAQRLCGLENKIRPNGKLPAPTKRTEDIGALRRPSVLNRLRCCRQCGEPARRQDN